ncbi:MAG: hypothetical protein ACRCX2_15895 [Paraclostridium sp.]
MNNDTANDLIKKLGEDFFELELQLLILNPDIEIIDIDTNG